MKKKRLKDVATTIHDHRQNSEQNYNFNPKQSTKKSHES